MYTISKSVLLFHHTELTILHKGKMAMTLRGVHRLLLSTAKGDVLWQLAYLRCDWLKQVAIILVHSNWLALDKGWSGLQFSMFE